jgi:hypothetical protein
MPSALYADMDSARKHRSYGLSWSDIYDDLLERLPYLHEERLILATDLLHNWFTNAQKYWSEHD